MSDAASKTRRYEELGGSDYEGRDWPPAQAPADPSEAAADSVGLEEDNALDLPGENYEQEIDRYVSENPLTWSDELPDFSSFGEDDEDLAATQMEFWRLRDNDIATKMKIFNRSLAGIRGAEKDALLTEQAILEINKKNYSMIEGQIKDRQRRINEVRQAQNNLLLARKSSIDGAAKRQQETINQLHSISKENPAQGILGGSLGVAASIIGAIRQAKFGGKNRAEEFLGRMVDVERKRLSEKMKSLRTISSAEDQMLQTILNSNLTEQETQNALYTAILQDSQDSINILQNQYKIQLETTALGQQTRATFAGLKAQSLQNQANSTGSSAKAYLDLMTVFQKNKGTPPTSGHLLSASRDDQMRNKKNKDFQDSIDEEWANVVVGTKMAELAALYIFGEESAGPIMQAVLSHAPNEVASLMRSFKNQFPDKWRDGIANYKKLMGMSKKAAYLEITKEQHGKLTEKDFTNGWERYVKPLDKPEQFLKEIATGIEGAAGAANALMIQASVETSAEKILGLKWFKGKDKYAGFTGNQKYVALNMPRANATSNTALSRVYGLLDGNYQELMNKTGAFPKDLFPTRFLTGPEIAAATLARLDPKKYYNKDMKEAYSNATTGKELLSALKTIKAQEKAREKVNKGVDDINIDYMP